MEGVRTEERNSKMLQVLLGSMDSLAIEPGLTENVSSHGLRVRTERPWGKDAVVIVLCSERGLWARARVVYCKALEDNTFAIGLEVLAGTGGRITW